MTSSLRADGPLSHVLVLDLTQFLAGPYASQILGDLGARVIKVEPIGGEMTRSVPPHFVKGESAYFLSVNRNKESLALDLKSARGREILLKLAKKCDVVLENFRPGVAVRLGIDYQALKRANPRLVVCSISGFGQEGPYRDLPAYDIIVQAISGGMSITGEENGRPVRAGIPLGDLAAGMYAVIGTLAGLARVKENGEGSYIDVSMLDCQISMLSYLAAYCLHSGELPLPQGRGHRSIPTYSAFRCSNGIEIVVAANTEKMWGGLCSVIGLEALTQDERFRSNADRLQNRAELDPILQEAFARLPSDQILEGLAAAGVPCGPINTVPHALSDTQVRHRDMVVDLRDAAGDTVQVVGNPVKFAGFDSTRHSYPPKAGEDGARILSEMLALSDEEIEELIVSKAISSVLEADSAKEPGEEYRKATGRVASV